MVSLLILLKKEKLSTLEDEDLKKETGLVALYHLPLCYLRYE